MIENFYNDEILLLRLSLSALDLDSFRHFLETDQMEVRIGLPPERRLRSWRLIADGHPTIAGLLLFGRAPQEHLPFAQVNEARIPGVDISNEPSDRKDLTGRLLEVIDQSMRFLDIHIPT